MAIGRRDSSLRHLGMLFTAGAVGQCTDAELLERFARRDSEGAELAFSTLVDRHGPMVLRVCRRALGDPQAAEDAFQATFLVLARKARSLVLTGPIAPWLHQVAWRTASRLRAAAARRRRHEKAAGMAKPLVQDGPQWDDLGEALHEELGRLPARYRVPLVLCYLEGLTAEQAARELGWAAGTVRSRLARGRERLRARLVRRGLAPSAAGLVAALASRSAWAAVPAELLNQTARAAMFVGAGRMAAGAVPASILTLTEGVLIEMAMTKWKLAGLSLLVAGVLASGAVVSAQAPAGPAAGQGESDRLKAVEAKLDRIVRALEGTGRKPPGPTEDDAQGPPRSYYAPVEHNPGQPRIQNEYVPVASPPGPNTGQSLPPPRDVPSSAGRGQPGSQVTSSFSARQAGLEQRVAELERRLARVEELLGSRRGAAPNPAAGLVGPLEARLGVPSDNSNPAPPGVTETDLPVKLAPSRGDGQAGRGHQDAQAGGPGSPPRPH
ncbi:MAG: RNA polymerase sigma factor [Caulobacteraceae bacterium]|nr:RNA polymerase sigma factor [Caulobacteraceae bacterium]